MEKRPAKITANALSAVERASIVPQEEVWLANFTSVPTQKAYRFAVEQFIATGCNPDIALRLRAQHAG